MALASQNAAGRDGMGGDLDRAAGQAGRAGRRQGDKGKALAKKTARPERPAKATRPEYASGGARRYVRPYRKHANNPADRNGGENSVTSVTSVIHPGKS